MSRVFRIKAGTMPAATPRVGYLDRVLQGGLPPVPYRQASRRWDSASRRAGEPFASRRVKAEIFGDRVEFRPH